MNSESRRRQNRSCDVGCCQPAFTQQWYKKEIRKYLHTELPAILITGDTSTPQISAADIPDCDILHKPVNTDELLALIREKGR